ncbi:MAG: type IV secretion system DNA-binding domain-containing protein [Paracoccaceae bacterium]|nr:type IV secretion system DNA-binding domain-containing protein [Paracoccaceae bacterium]
MAKNSPDQFIRGGQTTQHWIRMAAQVLRSAVAFAALVFAVVYAGLCFATYKVEMLHVTWAHWLASFFVENRGEAEHVIRYRHPLHGWVNEEAAVIYQNVDFLEVRTAYQDMAVSFAWWALVPAIVAALLAGLVFYLSGRKLDGDEHVRGTRLVSEKELKSWVDRKWKVYFKRFGKDRKSGPFYTVADIRFPPNAVEAQTAICGTVGTGKTTCIKELLGTVRDLGGRAIIYDRMGSFVRDFYDPATDVIINPFDARSRAWSPFLEAERPEFFTQMAEVLIPDRPGASGDPFWTQAARIVFDYAAQTLLKEGHTSNAALRSTILNIPGEQLAELIEATPGRHFLNEEIAKTAGSIRANLIAELRFLEFLRDDAEPFSIRKWVKSSETGFVFLTGDAEHAAATRNVISTLFEVAANALMTCDEANDPRVWFMMDEVPTLNKMPFLAKSLAEIRQFGGAFVVGYQVYSQLEDIYGEKGAQTIVGNLNNRIVFNTPDARTADLFSQSLGSEDVEERRETITVGAHEARDGVGFMSQRTERRIVTASQIQSLPQFEGYIRFAYDAPAAFVRFKPVERAGTAEKFIPYHGGSFAKGSMDAVAADQVAGENQPNCPSSFSGLSAEDQHAEFEAWRARLVASGLEIYAGNGADEAALWDHFASSRRAGESVRDIGPPSVTGHLMGAPKVGVGPVVASNETPSKTTNNAQELSQARKTGDPARIAPAEGDCGGELDCKPIDTSNPETQTIMAASETLSWPHHWSCAGGILVSVQDPNP